MWVKALDLLMDQLKITGLDFQDIRAISGAGQVKRKYHNLLEIITTKSFYLNTATWQCLLEKRS